jgi:hypothetical protein
MIAILSPRTISYRLFPQALTAQSIKDHGLEVVVVDGELTVLTS